MNPITRRNAFRTATVALAAAAVPVSVAASPSANPRLKQAVCRGPWKKFTLDELCQHCVRIGLKGIDLVDHTEWPTIQKYGLMPSMTPGAGNIPDCWNRLDNHEKLVHDMEENIPRAAAAGVPNVITFSGNRKGMPDGEGLENCLTGLNRVKKLAEEKGVTINLELLNSKVNHKDYMADHTAWGVELCKRVASPRVKLLYDIYHMQIMEGDVIRTIRDNFAFLGHFHTGGVPGRHEIDEAQELNYRAIAAAIADLGFTDYLAHEFSPTAPDQIKSLEKAYEICNV
jgi:hydroxypyruvate isomerase